MNLQSIASPYTATVSPPTIGVLYVSNGNTVNADFSQTPAWTVFTNAVFDVQAVSGQMLAHLASMNITGILRSVYIQGSVEAIDRNAGKGGDVLLFGGIYWKVVQVAEPWANNGWTRVIVQQQVGVPPGITP